MLIRVSAISYLNTLPFVYGLMNHPVYEKIELTLSTPEASARDLIEGRVDIGIVPSAVIPQIGVNNIISDYCIGADGKVASVLLCSGVEVKDIEKVYLDSESRTSVMLSRILFRNHWKIDPSYSPFEASKSEIDTGKSYILIGDKALLYADKFRFVYDLAEEWIKFRRLPFVFACWTSNRKLEDSFIKEFNDALAFGLDNIENSLRTLPHIFDYTFAYKYLKNNISFNLSPDKREGLSEFWSLALEEMKSKVRWFG
ncbi:MAG: radical SAM protein [Bacteroidetes bacterium HGW-Bacteroidetes-5]|nr:MAG: radical SAM protein [Bacteroidetes bacterium HGW-Bacteroidetes-5]